VPFVARKGDKIVIPTQVEDGSRCICPACQKELGVKNAHYRGNSFVARHFFHLVETDCPGESDEHIRMKAITHSKLEDKYPQAEVVFEETVDSSGRRADVLVTFEEPRGKFGRGLAVEVQYMNKQKNIEEVERDYLEQDYSVLWLHEEDFSGRNVRIHESDIVSVFPNAVPATETDEYYPDLPKRSPHRETISPLPNTQNSDIKEAVAEGWLDGKRKRILKKAEGRFPEQNGEWQNGVTKVRTSSGGVLSLSMTPDGKYILKAEYDGDDVRVRVSRFDSNVFYKNAKALCVTDIDGIMGGDWRKGVSGEWVNLTDGRFRGGRYTTSWVNPSVSPMGLLMVSVGKKKSRESNVVQVRISKEDIPHLLTFFMEVSVLLENLRSTVD
jgi:hypothetical protein